MSPTDAIVHPVVHKDQYELSFGRLRALMHVYGLANTVDSPHEEPLLTPDEHAAIEAMAEELFDEVDAAVQSLFTIAKEWPAPTSAEGTQ